MKLFGFILNNAKCKEIQLERRAEPFCCNVSSFTCMHHCKSNCEIQELSGTNAVTEVSQTEPLCLGPRVVYFFTAGGDFLAQGQIQIFTHPVILKLAQSSRFQAIEGPPPLHTLQNLAPHLLSLVRQSWWLEGPQLLWDIRADTPARLLRDIAQRQEPRSGLPLCWGFPCPPSLLGGAPLTLCWSRSTDSFLRDFLACISV